MPSQLAEQRRQHLTELGFKSVGGSAYLAHQDKEGFVLTIDPVSGRYNFFIDYEHFIDPRQVKAISVGRFDEFSNTPAIQVLQTNKDGVLATGSYTDGSMNSYLAKPEDELTAKLQQLSLLPITAQLAAADFTEDPDDSGVWKIKIKDGGQQDVIAIIKDDVLLQLLTPIDQRIFQYYQLDETTEILAVNKYPKALSPTISLSLRSNLLTGELFYSLGIASLGEIQQSRELTAKELGLEDQTPYPDKSSPSFMICGTNSTEVIRNLNGLNGQSLAELEDEMRPGKLGGAASFGGFISKDDSLIDVLAVDNEFVQSLGLTHQDLALPLRYVAMIVNFGFGEEFAFRGSEYKVDVLGNYVSAVLSPFHDDTGGRTDVEVHNLTNGKSMHFNLLLGEMINRYGFYEGKVGHRVEPEVIIEVFPYLKQVSDERSKVAK